MTEQYPPQPEDSGQGTPPGYPQYPGYPSAPGQSAYPQGQPGYPQGPQGYPPPAYGQGQPGYPQGQWQQGQPGFPGGGYGYGSGYGYGQQQVRNGLGIAGFVLSILGVFPFFELFLFSILGLIFSLIGRSRVKRNEANNGGLVLAGLILSVLGLVLGVIFWIYVGTHTHCTTNDSGQRVCSTNNNNQQT